MGYNESETTMSPLAKTQNKVLKQSWDMYLTDIYPEAVNWMKTGGESYVDKLFPKQVQGVNAAYDSAKQGVSQQLAQRGLLGTGSGVEAASATNLQTGRAKSLSESYANVLFQDQSQRDQKRMNALSLLMGKSPQPTTAAPMESHSSSFDTGLGSLVGGLGTGVGAVSTGGALGMFGKKES